MSQHVERLFGMIADVHPKRKPDSAWLWIFVPALVAYVVVLNGWLNQKIICGQVDVYNAKKMKQIFSSYAQVELLHRSSHRDKEASWFDGPLWIEDENDSSLGYLLYNDVKQNQIHRWENGKGLYKVGNSLFHNQSGCYRNDTQCNEYAQHNHVVGSNTLLRLPSVYSTNPKFPNAMNLLVAQYGERGISLFHENGTRTVLVSHYRGHRFNGPNDVILTPEGHLFFTDFAPKPKATTTTTTTTSTSVFTREIPWNGIYWLNRSAVASSVSTGVASTLSKLVAKDTVATTHPNALAFSPDFSKLFVANGSPRNAHWRVFHVLDNGQLKPEKVLFNLTEHLIKENKSKPMTPRGLKVDVFGNIFAVAGNSVFVFAENDDDENNNNNNNSHELIGQIRLHDVVVADAAFDKQEREMKKEEEEDEVEVTDVAFGGDGYLYITTTTTVARLAIKTKPVRILSKLTRGK